jgi:hypothetical protein
MSVLYNAAFGDSSSTESFLFHVYRGKKVSAGLKNLILVDARPQISVSDNTVCRSKRNGMVC